MLILWFDLDPFHIEIILQRSNNHFVRLIHTCKARWGHSRLKEHLATFILVTVILGYKVFEIDSEMFVMLDFRFFLHLLYRHLQLDFVDIHLIFIIENRSILFQFSQRWSLLYHLVPGLYLTFEKTAIAHLKRRFWHGDQKVVLLMFTSFFVRPDLVHDLLIFFLFFNFWLNEPFEWFLWPLLHHLVFPVEGGDSLFWPYIWVNLRFYLPLTLITASSSAIAVHILL